MRFRITPATRGSSISRPCETSRLAPIRDSESIFKQWRKLAHTMTQQANHASQQSLARVAQGRDLWQFQADSMHPFKLYRFPVEMQMRKLPIDDLKKAWRTFRVRGGYVMTTTAQGIGVQFTDRVMDLPYQQAMFSKADGSSVNQSLVRNVIVPEDTQRFYFWIELAADASEALLRWHADPSQAHYADDESADHNCAWDSANPWTSWPKPDSQHFLIGWVDTKSQANIHRALPRQVQTTDIIAGGGTSTCSIYG